MSPLTYAKHLIAAASTVVTVLVIGYLSIQAEGMTKGYLFDLSGAPALSVVKRFPWEIQIGAILFGLAVIATYWKFTITRSVRGVVLATLIVAAIGGGLFFDAVHAAPTGLVAVSFVMGGVSFFTLALIAGVLTDLIFRPATDTAESSTRTRMSTKA